MNELGYRTSRGNPFSKNSFYSMLRNEKYIGEYHYNNDIRIEGGVPAIIDKNTFEVAQARRKKNARAGSPGKAKVDYLLSGKIFCGHCSSPMVGESGKSVTGAVYYYYACGKRKRYQTCNKKTIRKDYIEQAVTRGTISLLTDETIDMLAEMAIKQNQDDIDNDVIISALKKELNEYDKSIANLLRLAEKGIESESVVGRIAELEKQKRDCERRLKEAKKEYIVLEKPQVVWWISLIKNSDINDEDFCRRLIDLLVNSVTVYDEPDGTLRVTTIYNLTGDNTQSFILDPSTCTPSP